MSNPYRAQVGPPHAQDPSETTAPRVVMLIEHGERREYLCRLIEERAPGCRVDHTATPLEALRCLSRAPCDLLVLDHAIDGLAGSSLVRHLARAAPTLPILAFADSAAALLNPPVEVLPWSEAAVALARAIQQRSHTEPRTN
jgi:CheY-like chemotaxis protein